VTKANIEKMFNECAGDALQAAQDERNSSILGISELSTKDQVGELGKINLQFSLTYTSQLCRRLLLALLEEADD